MRTLAIIFVLSWAFVANANAAEPTVFSVPGHEREMQSLNELHALHQERAFSDCTLWDPWLPHSTLWTSARAREQYRASFLRRRINNEGYVSMQQHRGMAHSEGWPFPAWQQGTGKGWHFSVAHDGWAVTQLGLKALTTTEGWQIVGAKSEGIDPATGLKLAATDDRITLTTPDVRCDTVMAPFLRIEWSAVGLSPDSRPSVSWQFQGEEAWQETRRADFPALSNKQGMQFANVPLYKQPGYSGKLARFRITFDRASGAKLTLKSVITAVDSRHPITNSLFLRGCCEYFMWTKDVDFLRANLSRMRTSLRFALAEFSVFKQHHVLVPWVGHDGRSGLVLSPDGKKTQRHGLGVGNNYWDLLPFGGHDALATIYLFDALNRFIKIEEALANHADWKVGSESQAFDIRQLEELRDSIRNDFQQRFWDAEDGRFVGWIDLEGTAYDYGFTFVNLEAIHYGLASREQALSVFDWLDGRREIAGDTSRGADIYHWRFAPRATTKRNIETYAWMWSGPETIPWGGQVQDGGAVLGFSYFDLMSRLKVLGPDNAWDRLREILVWFGEVQSEGGYRAYYAKPGRGTLQGGGTAGGLGLDQEFFESVLVPQTMLYGFLGVEPNAMGISINPSLPKAWPSLCIDGVQSAGYELKIEAFADQAIAIEVKKAGSQPLIINTRTQSLTILPTDIGTTKRLTAKP